MTEKSHNSFKSNTKIILEYLEKFPNSPTKTLARKIYQENQEYEKALFELNEDGRVPNQHDVDFIENEDNHKITNIKWPSIGEFTVEIGEHKIDEFIKTVIKINYLKSLKGIILFKIDMGI